MTRGLLLWRGLVIFYRYQYRSIVPISFTAEKGKVQALIKAEPKSAPSLAELMTGNTLGALLDWEAETTPPRNTASAPTCTARCLCLFWPALRKGGRGDRARLLPPLDELVSITRRIGSRPDLSVIDDMWMPRPWRRWLRIGKTNAPSHSLPYCTRAWLLGLAHRKALDPSCPNTPLHNTEGGSRHLLSVCDISALLRTQVEKDLDDGCRYLDMYGMFGAIGALFKMTLAGYGYTFVAKGVQEVDNDALKRESEVYPGFIHFQGRFIPVYLGMMDLVQPYGLTSGAM
ncbi:uncharacterized protein B0H64DRAFT_374568 [Chaetomium fimeti]|uniref:Uncharacterized protein n=1 Tax=Chaetomium fimeti TaxID=1854472 RepID=A0AAE0HHS7_9PEZI|nr:hypothetical protein B0H64DRAFT_374568 [Chaetomium fimeti]